MSYQVLARKWRPHDFVQMVGQTHVIRALVNALQAQRLHHAYLFTGTRGVGKTTVARVLAKCLNCETGITAKPCGQCSACKEIDAGRFLDLIEVDAASRTGVDDTRELLENVPYAPSKGRFKVYLIDEVHMFSKSSFNALLKTLEEPPTHVKFLLATTDPQKMPPTVLSRCLQFHLKPMPAEMIATHLANILQHEQIPAESAALLQIARAASGSMRDALSLLDQAIAYGSGALVDDQVRQMLGIVPRAHLFALLDALVAADVQAVFAALQALAEQAPDYEALLGELITLFHQLALLQKIPQLEDGLFEDTQRLTDLAGRISPEDIQLYYQIAVLARRDLPFVPDPRIGLEMALLRMSSFRLFPLDASIGSAAASPVPAVESKANPNPSHGSDLGTTHTTVDRLAAQATPPAAATMQATTPIPPTAQMHTPGDDATPTSVLVAPSPGQPLDWGSILPHLELRGMASALATHCALLSYDGETLRLGVMPEHTTMKTATSQQRITEAIQRVLGEHVNVIIDSLQTAPDPHLQSPAQKATQAATQRQQAAEQAIQSDAVTQTLKQNFDAEIVPGSIRPIDR